MELLNAVLIWWLRGTRYKWSRLRRRLFERRYLDVVLPDVNSTEDIEACLKKVTWSKDGVLHLYDCISYPQTVWARKKDDCDGFAVLAAELLHRWDPDTNPVLVTAIVRPIKLSHTICAFRYGKNLFYFDNDTLRKGFFQEYGDIVAVFTKGVEKVVCWDMVKPGTLEQIDFHIN